MTEKLPLKVPGHRHRTALPSKPKHKIPQTAGCVSSYEGWFKSECLNPAVSSSARNRDLHDRNSDSLLCFLVDEALPDPGCTKLCSSSSFFDCSGKAKQFRRRRTRRNCQSSVSWDPPVPPPSSSKDLFPNIDDLFPKELHHQQNRINSEKKTIKSRTAGYRNEEQFSERERAVEINYSRSTEAGNLKTDQNQQIFLERSNKFGILKNSPQISPAKAKALPLPPIYQKPLIQQVNWPAFHSSFESLRRPSSELSEASVRTVSPAVGKMAQFASSSDTNLMLAAKGKLQRPLLSISELYPFQLGNLRIEQGKSRDRLDTSPLSNSPFFDATKACNDVAVNFELKKFNHISPFFDSAMDNEGEAALRMAKVKTDLANSRENPPKSQTSVLGEKRRKQQNNDVSRISDYSDSAESLRSNCDRIGGSKKILAGNKAGWECKHIPCEDSSFHLDTETMETNQSTLRTITRTLDHFNEQPPDRMNDSLDGAESSNESFQGFSLHYKDYSSQDDTFYELADKNQEFAGASRTSSSTTVILATNDHYNHSARYNSLSNEESDTFLPQQSQPTSTNSTFKPQIKPAALPAFSIKKPMQFLAHCSNPSPVHEPRSPPDISKTTKIPIYKPEMRRNSPTILSPKSKLTKQKYKTPTNKQNSASSPAIPSSKANTLPATYEAFQNVAQVKCPVKYMSGDFDAQDGELNACSWAESLPTNYDAGDSIQEKEFAPQLVERQSSRTHCVSDSQSSLDSSSTYVIQNPSSRSSKNVSPFQPRPKSHVSGYCGHNDDSPTCLLPSVSHQERNVVTSEQRDLKRGCKTHRENSTCQRFGGRNVRCKTSTTAELSSPRVSHRTWNAGRRNKKDYNTTRLRAHEMTESCVCESSQECNGGEKTPGKPATVECLDGKKDVELLPCLCPTDRVSSSSTTAKLELDPFRAVRIPSFELMPAILEEGGRVREVSTIELNFELHLQPMWKRNLIVEKQSSTSGNQSNSRFNEAFKNCLLPDMLPSTTNIPRDSLNIMREAGDFLTAYRKPGSSSFVDKLPEFAAYYDLMHESQPTSIQYSNVPSLPLSPSTSNATCVTIQSLRSQKGNRRCNLRGLARCMSFCRRNFSLRKTSLSSRFRWLFPRCCCSRRWHYRHSSQFAQK